MFFFTSKSSVIYCHLDCLTDFNGVVLVQNYLERTGRGTWAKQFREAAMSKDDTELLRVMANYGEDVVEALGYEVDRLESEIKKLVPGIKHVDIEAHNPEGLTLRAEVL
ncbi:Metal tolerance protein C4 [Zea mays]|uniref:Metal tolerance protein C4 n=1 Tax=Zea mays TaxID=4577 RepID=A0A1D6J540_MAIZE|nr:Metal tolerance protein C4 [Zea mays]